jgi:gliding-associated putative ABC transporter substrate-binding component GldG
MVDSRRSYGLSTVSLTILVAAVVVVLNLVSTRFFGRADLTQGNIYSLSEASRNVAVRLDDPLIARAYVSSGLPPQLITVRQYLLDLLAEYRAYGKGNFQFEVISPTTDEEEAEAQAYGIVPFQANVYQQDKVELKRVHLGLVFIHGDQQEALPAITGTGGLEYQLTSAIRRVTRQSLGNIGVLAETGGPTLTEGLARLREAVGKEYRIRSVDLATAPVPADITMMAVIGPQQDLSDSVLYRLDQYVMRGGPVLFLLEGGVANLQGPPDRGGGVAFESRFNIDSLAGHYGASPKPEFVLDARHNQIQAMQNLGFLQIPVRIDFPFFVVGTSASDEHVLSREQDRVDLLFVSPLELKPPAEARLQVLVRSSDRSGVRKLPTMVMPPVEVSQADYSAPGQPLAVAVEGIHSSYFADTAKAADLLLGPAYDTAFLSRSVDTRMLIVGDADLASDQGLTQFNQVFLLNAFDWLSRNDLLIALRSRQVQDRPLKETEPGARSRIKWANLLGPSLLVVLFGLVRWRRRVAAHRNV